MAVLRATYGIGWGRRGDEGVAAGSNVGGVLPCRVGLCGAARCGAVRCGVGRSEARRGGVGSSAGRPAATPCGTRLARAPQTFELGAMLGRAGSCESFYLIGAALTEKQFPFLNV